MTVMTRVNGHAVKMITFKKNQWSQDFFGINTVNNVYTDTSVYRLRKLLRRRETTYDRLDSKTARYIDNKLLIKFSKYNKIPKIAMRKLLEKLTTYRARVAYRRFLIGE